ISDDGGDALARQPRRTPLRESAPGAFGTPEMEGRREQAQGDERQRDEDRCHPKPPVARDQIEGTREAEEKEKAIARPRGGSEQDDGIGGMHEAESENRKEWLARQYLIGPLQE